MATVFNMLEKKFYRDQHGRTHYKKDGTLYTLYGYSDGVNPETLIKEANASNITFNAASRLILTPIRELAHQFTPRGTKVAVSLDKLHWETRVFERYDPAPGKTVRFYTKGDIPWRYCEIVDTTYEDDYLMSDLLQATDPSQINELLDRSDVQFMIKSCYYILERKNGHDATTKN